MRNVSKSILEETRRLGIKGTMFRVNYELSKKLGFIEKKHAPVQISSEDLIHSLDLKNPALDAVQKAYNSRKFDLATTELIFYLKSRESPRFFFDWHDRNEYQKILNDRFAEDKIHLVEQADKICRHEIEVYGPECEKLGDEINWHCDPETGRNWPLIHWSKIDIRSTNRIGDVKFTWEINRHQFLFALGRAYWFTGDEKYAKKATDLMRSWIAQNPPEVGINWYSNLEIAIRLISWIWAYNFFLDSPSFDDKLHLDFLKIVLHSCRHITKDFKYSLLSMRNNHVIGDATAMAFAGIMFPEFRESIDWRKNYIKILYRELENQVNEDGTDFEQATSYHKFVLYFYLLLFRIMQINRYDFPDHYSEKIEKMVEFMMHIMKPDGTMPQIGDCDDAKVLLLSNEDVSYLKPTLSTGALLFHRGDFKQMASKLSQETFWLGGKDSIQIFDALEETNPSIKSAGFPEGGYYIMRSGFESDAKYLLFKSGPHADHGHADDLHIEMHSGGKSLLRDCGTYTYNGPLEWRNYFRSTKAHNTIVIDNESQRTPHRVFRWLNIGETKTNVWITSDNFDYVDAEHSGYGRYEDPVIHKRSVFFVKPEYWLILDRLMASREHSVELLFHTPYSDVTPETSGNTFRTQDFAIIPVDVDDFTLNINQCREEPIQGWFSPCYGIKQPSTTIAYTYQGKLPKVIPTILDTGIRILSAKCIMQNERGLAIQLESKYFLDTFIFNWDAVSGVSVKGINTDANVAYIREDVAKGKVTRIALVNGSYINLEGKLHLAAKSLVKSFDLITSESGETAIRTDPKTEIQKSFHSN